jgi:hypothetical protein
MSDDDVIWFRQRARRDYRIRVPAQGEFACAWIMLGMHNQDRRRVLVWRVPKNNPGRKMIPDGLMRVPFLAEADESIEDDDFVLKRLMARMMKDAAEAKPVGGFAITGGGAIFENG